MVMNTGARGRVQKQFDQCLILCKHIKFCSTANKGNMKGILRGYSDSICLGHNKISQLTAGEVIKSTMREDKRDF